ncbi:sialate O-acetylesterase [Roseimicrobium sp. ORNL1]|uniref:sialate O-acetylesterase n=1 Tax=Roseimicrobium sp. ORNL1 TaxID=2711231 RepID=UPI0013E1D2D0|nr:sialate O-acetylesterase [Roseimicrobium sp. ORNL1]QIF03983.1 sialate O-acetylesterase [Roseimicrobium sp. ORNL1]
MKRLVFFAALSGILAAPLQAVVRLHPLFSDHAVLQCDKPVPVWGWAGKGEEVTVTFADQSKNTKADEQGKWMVKLEPMKATTKPATLEAKGTNTITVADVLVGEVWLGSGQSNMAMTVNRAKDFEKEKQAAELPQIRMFTVRSGPANEPQAECEGQWTVCSPETVGAFSATAYFFGREIHDALKLPVGLINSSVGGTPIDSWVSAEAQRASLDLKPLLAALEVGAKEFDPAVARAQYEKQLERWNLMVTQAREAGKPLPRKPRDPVETTKRKGNIGGLYNGKIAPLAPYALRGFLWYQGEANTTPQKAAYYQYHLPLLVTEWRKDWGDEQLPFAWVQLPNYVGRADGWCLVREAMLKTLKLPKTGMAVTIDVGEAKDIHPKNKQAVGQRLGLWALNTVYGKNNEFRGPTLDGHDVGNGKVVLSFTNAEGLTAKGGELKEFVIAGEDHQWKPAKAEIVDGKIQVSSPDVPSPIAVRYAWTDNCQATLFNSAGLPASPFRTDDWPVKLEEPPVRPVRAKAAAKNPGASGADATPNKKASEAQKPSEQK